jgi:hypothetical protein
MERLSGVFEINFCALQNEISLKKITHTAAQLAAINAFTEKKVEAIRKRKILSRNRFSIPLLIAAVHNSKRFFSTIETSLHCRLISLSVSFYLTMRNRKRATSRTQMLKN